MTTADFEPDQDLAGVPRQHDLQAAIAVEVAHDRLVRVARAPRLRRIARGAGHRDERSGGSPIQRQHTIPR